MTETPVEGTQAQRGRPRPDATVERDELVFKHIEAEGPKTRPELASELDMPGNQVYLSLYRLSRSDPPRIVKAGGKWSVAGAAPVE